MTIDAAYIAAALGQAPTPERLAKAKRRCEELRIDWPTVEAILAKGTPHAREE